MIPRDEWVWMPHAGHLIVSRDCIFHLTTRVGGYLVSTLGEYWPDSQVRRIHAEVRGTIIAGIGDEWDHNYLQEFGYEDVGFERKYETMVFRAKRDKAHGCCPWRASDWSEIDMDGYNDAGDAYHGHLAMCEKYAKE